MFFTCRFFSITFFLKQFSGTYFLGKKNYTKLCALITGLFFLGFLAGCSDDHKTSKSSSSRFSSSSTSYSSDSNSSLYSTSSSSSLSVSPYSGQWHAPAYGYVLSVTAEGGVFTVKTYSVTKDYCLQQNLASNLSMADFQQSYNYSNFGKEVLVKINGNYAPGVEYERLQKLPETCRKKLQTLKTDAGYTFDAKRDFEIFWQTYNELYVNFELRDTDWNDVYTEAINSVTTIKNETELFEFLSNLVTPLGDGHAILINTPLSKNLDESITAALENEETPMFSSSTQSTLREKLTDEYLQMMEISEELTEAEIDAAEKYIVDGVEKIKEIIFSYANKDSDIHIKAAGEIAWFITSDNLGYLFIGSMSDYREGESTVISDIDADVAIAQETISEALLDMQNTKGLIIDVRFNGGGQDQVSLAFVRHFMSQPQVVYSKYAGSGMHITPIKSVVLNPQSANIYLNPTAVLVSGDTGSAAELFTIAMSSLPQVTIIGEQTAGAFSDVLVKRLTSDILFGVSNETYLDVQGNNYEGVGISPDIIVPFGTLQERKGSYDGGLDAAINWIKNTQMSIDSIQLH